MDKKMKEIDFSTLATRRSIFPDRGVFSVYGRGWRQLPQNYKLEIQNLSIFF